MKFLSASQDFEKSIEALPRLLRKLQYVSQLHELNGYEHWGLVKCHGKAAAEAAMRKAHEKLFLEFLRTPIRELAEAGALREGPACLKKPDDLVGGSGRHFNSIVMALRYLSEAGQAQANPAA